MDYVAGNQGLNNRFTASPEEPMRLVVDEFRPQRKPGGGESYYVQGENVPLLAATG